MTHPPSTMKSGIHVINMLTACSAPLDLASEALSAS
jgi:hypothetical protein